jgi:hypothetical protein
MYKDKIIVQRKNGKYMKKLNDYEKGFLEGLIDGEGSLIIHKDKRKDCKLGWTPHIRITISNRNKQLLEKARNMFGGGYIIRKPDDSYELRVGPNLTRKTLPQLNLIVKEKRKIKVLNILNLLKVGRNQFTYDEFSRQKLIEEFNDLD